MNREQVYADIEETLGLVPSFFKELPDDALQKEWELFAQLEGGEGPVDNKTRQLIGLGIAATVKCEYCLHFHAEMAKVFGATEEEIEHAVRFAKHTNGWSAYVSGLQVDMEQFKSEVDQAADHLRKQLQKQKRA